MFDVSGIPNMGFGGGGYFGGIPNQAPAMSANQINQGIWGNYSPGQAQSTLNNIYGAGGFGALPSYYAGLGAAYGRATGGYGGAPGRVGTIGNPGTSNPGYNPGNPYAAMMGRYPTPPVQRGPDLPAPYTPSPIYNPAAMAQASRDALARAMQTSPGAMSRLGTPNINLGYNPGMANTFAPQGGFNANPFQNRFGMGFGGQAPTMRPDYSSNPLTPMDRLGAPHSFGPGIYQNSPFGS